MIKKTSVLALLAPLLVLFPGTYAMVSADEATLAMGKQAAEDQQRGNCLACHMMGDGEAPGNHGPPLIAMKVRFPDKAKLKAQIANPLEVNPDSMMPPFGLHGVVSDEELDAIVEYLYTL